jgi:predicted RNA-binding protein YlxR (DUF448 family)
MNETPRPARTCIGCRRRDSAEALARLALHEGRVVLWAGASQRSAAEKRPGGRGASLHPDGKCLRDALKSGAFARAFRTKVSLDEADLLQQLTAVTAASRSRNRTTS